MLRKIKERIMKKTKISQILLITAVFFLTLFGAEVLSQSKNPKPLLRKEAFLKQRAYPGTDIPRQIRVNALKKVDNEMLPEKHRDKILADMPEWQCIGPRSIAGRVKSIVFHPENENILYIAAASGGIWKTTDKGSSWVPLFDEMPSLAFGSIAVDPVNPDILYAGTGESALGAGVVYMGAGMFKTTNAGTDWKYIGLGKIGAFSKVYVHPKNASLIIAGASEMESGLYISTNAGMTWQRNFELPVTDISLNPADEDEFYIGVSGRGIYYSSDGGNTWEKRNKGIHSGIGRVSVQMCVSNPDILYALMEINEKGRIYKSSDKGKNWTAVFDGGESFFYYQGFYNNFIMVHPSNPSHAVAGGIDIYLTTDGGKNWSNKSKAYSGGNVHMDQHCGVYNPQNPDEIFIGNDGGVYRSTDAGQTWLPKNNQLAITQFYALALDERQAYRTFGGTQDNGTSGNPSSETWDVLLKGDGFRVIVDPDNADIIYGEYYNGGLWKYDLKENKKSTITNGIPANDYGSWNSPFLKSPIDNNVFYHARTAVYKSTNKGSNWEKISKNLYAPISALEISDADGTKIWAGSEAGEFYFSADGNNWQNFSGSGIPNRFISDIESSHQNSSKVYISVSGYGSGHVFKSIDNGETFTDIGSNLPDIPVNALAVHPDNDDIVFAATDIGVFYTPDGGFQWMKYGKVLPNCPAVDLEFHTNKIFFPEYMLRAATHGRSIWEIPVSADIIPEPQILSPAGGDFFVKGSLTRISFTGFSLPVKIRYSPNNGNDWKILTENASENYFDWKINEDETDFGIIEISSNENPQQKKNSPNFSILPRKNGSLIKTGGVPFNTYGIAYNGNGALWAVTNDKGIVYKIDADTYEILGEFMILYDIILTDIAYDSKSKRLYFAKPYNFQIGGSIEITDTGGNYQYNYNSPAEFPCGLAVSGGKLICGDRDGERMIFVLNPENGNVLYEKKNPFQETYGPRCLCTDGEYIYQVSTRYAETTIQESMLIKMDKENFTSLDTVYLNWQDGVISARGCEYDPRDGSFWITDLYGSIYKIAAFDEPTEVKENKQKKHVSTNIYPNPADNHIIVTINQTEFSDDVMVEIYNGLGILLGTHFADDGHGVSRSCKINTAGFPAGMYYLKIRSGRGIFSIVKPFAVTR